MKTVLCTDESRVLPNDTDGLTKGWVFNDDNYTVGIWRKKSGLVIIISGRMIGNELTSLFREPEELNCPLTCIALSTFFFNRFISCIEIKPKPPQSDQGFL